jgi:hypothetical protein
MKKTILLLLIMGSFCFLSKSSFSQAPSWLWARAAGGNSYNEATSVTTDALGNSYVAGYYNIFAYDLPHASGPDIFFVKYDPSGNIIWTRSLSSTGTDRVFSIATDKLGHFYIFGCFSGPEITIGTDSLINLTVNKFDLFVAKYDTTGNCLWTKHAGGTGEDTPTGMAIDSLGNCFVTGYFASPTISFGIHTLTNTGVIDLFIAKYAPDGTELWAKSASGSSNELSKSVAVDKFGNSYITGDFISDSISFDGLILTKIGNQDMFVAKYAPNGTVLWARQSDGTLDTHGNSIAVDALANCYVAGSFSSNVTFDTTTLTSNGTLDILLVKYATDGTVQWAKSAGGTVEDAATSVATDMLGYCYLAGYFKSASVSIGTYPLTNNGSGFQDIFVAEYNSAGSVVWAKSVGGLTNDYPNDIQPDLSRDILIAGSLGSTSITIGDTTLYNAGTTNILVAKSGNTAATGTIEFRDPVSISVYPNPAVDKLTINSLNKSTIEILNMQGQRIIQLKLKQEKTELDISGLAKGIYILKLNSNDKTEVTRFVKE